MNPLHPSGERVAILIGVEGSLDPEVGKPLSAVHHDVAAMAAVLEQPECGFRVASILTGPTATVETIKQTLADAMLTLTMDDTLIIYFTGHGYVQADAAGQWQVFLVTTDFKRTHAEAFPTHYLSLRMLQSEFLTNPRLPVGRVVTILDCCYAGWASVHDTGFETWIEQLRDVFTIKRSNNPDTQITLRQVFMGSRPYEAAYATEQQSLFTAMFCEALDGRLRGEVTLDAIKNYINPRLPESQRSGLSGYDYANHFALANYGVSYELPPALIDPLQAAQELLAKMPTDEAPIPAPLPPKSRILLARNPQFVGRDEELYKLARILKAETTAALVPTVATTGLGGIGKTNLATEFVYRYGQFFQGGIFWLNCADPMLISSEVVACAPALDIRTAGISFDDIVAQVCLAWQDPLPRLLIFDNCEDPKVLKQWQPTIGGCRVLVTARRSLWPSVWTVPVGILTRPESIALVQHLCSRLTLTEINAIAEDLGDLPLALHLASCYLATYDHVTGAAYLDQLSLNHPSLQGRGTEESPTAHELHVARTFALSYDQLNPVMPVNTLARWILACAAHCAPGIPIPRDLLLAMVPENTPPDDAVDALSRLRIVGLLEGVAELTLHRLLAQFVLDYGQEIAFVIAAEEALINRASLINKAGQPSAMIPLLPHLRHMVQKAYNRHDEQAAGLFADLGDHFREVGNFAEARPLLEYALQSRETTLGPDHTDTATSLSALGWLLAYTAAYDEARSLVERALTIRETALGPTHPDTAQSLNDLGSLLHTIGDFKEARPLVERALAIRETALGPTHPDTAQSLSNLGFLLEATGDDKGARPLYERALAICEKELGPTHPRTAQSLTTLASLFRNSGNFKEARPLLERALAICEKELGPDHPSTSDCLNNLASLLQGAGDYRGSRLLLERALVISEKVLGLNHPSTAKSLSNLATAWLASGVWGKARPLLQQAVTILEQTLGKTHPTTQGIRTNLDNLEYMYMRKPIPPRKKRR